MLTLSQARTKHGSPEAKKMVSESHGIQQRVGSGIRCLYSRRSSEDCEIPQKFSRSQLSKESTTTASPIYTVPDVGTSNRTKCSA